MTNKINHKRVWLYIVILTAFFVLLNFFTAYKQYFWSDVVMQYAMGSAVGTFIVYFPLMVIVVYLGAFIRLKLFKIKK